jgi:PAS domain S-box-containing protein
MSRRLRYTFAIVLLVISTALVVWLGSFKELRQFGPSNPGQTFIFWAVSILIFVLMVTLGWVLIRTAVKLYVERQSNQEGSRIRTKLVLGALALSIVPVFCLVLFSYYVLSYNMRYWFTKPAEQQIQILDEVAKQLDKEMRDETSAHAALLAAQPEVRAVLSGRAIPAVYLEQYCKERELASAAIYPPGSEEPVAEWPHAPVLERARMVYGRHDILDGPVLLGSVAVAARVPLDIVATKAEMTRMVRDRERLYEDFKTIRFNYMMLMALITLFVLSVATWIALFLAKQISIPITALLNATREVRHGNLRHRVDVRAGDELGSLVRSFNQMTQELETSSAELDLRRRFTEAILESIPTGVISIGPDGYFRRVNRALAKIFPPDRLERANRLEDLFPREDAAEIKYLMKRARRTGSASRQLEVRAADRNLQITVTVAALEEKLTSGFVIVLEDTTELRRAEKAAAWHEVARRVAHEIKNPLTPIALSAERIARQIERLDLPPAAARIFGECAATIGTSVESVKTLVDEFSQFARFPAAQPVRSDLNAVVHEALTVFQGRLDGISIHTAFAPGLPPVNIDREHFQRLVVNLVDNAAEAMQDSLVKELYISTQHGAADTVELVMADTGCGVAPEEKEKLFLPYFSTKNRGTGLGLAIVSHIVAEHNAQIRVEDNLPVGARFTVEIPAILETDAADPGARSTPISL